MKRSGISMVENVKELIKAHEGIKHEVYLDNENSTMVPNEIIEKMLPYYNKRSYGNPTLTHKPGWEAFETIMESAQKISEFIGAKILEEITFTPGATEANNLALLGSILSKKNSGKKIVISEIEPISIIRVTEMLEKFGFSIIKIHVDGKGFVNLEELQEQTDKDVVLVSLSAVNNEIGTIQPLKDAVRIAKEKNPNVIFHTDASDAYGRIGLNVRDLNVDMATINSYKILGPRGIGALYTKEGLEIDRILEGQIGTQRLWPGIENTPLIVGFTKASETVFQDFEKNINHVKVLRDKLMDGIFGNLSEVILNGPKNEKRAPDNLNISFLRCEGEALTIELSLRGVYVSSGSACSRRLLQPSHVLVAIGRKFSEAHGSILMKISRLHTKEDINYVLDELPKAVNRIRGIVGSTGID
jgi:cysteine desulfurase